MGIENGIEFILNNESGPLGPFLFLVHTHTARVVAKTHDTQS